MSDFMPRDILPDLWNEILKRHWTYLETEESIRKIEERKKLEGCLKEFLCMVQHDRKFFLPETGKVLKTSIRELNDFSAQTAILAFESISQYANNLFTKPWRKEFRVLKMYSGFYQHEIKSNLLHAEKLFEAMGYRRLSDDTLILDGPICPDQVTNVSRDAMAAYVELQIMKHIYTGLDAIGITCSWLEIYRYREKYTGGTSQAIKALAFTMEEKHYRAREKALAGDNYGYIDVQASSNYSLTPTQYHPSQCQCNACQQLPSAPTTRHRTAMAQTNGMCCVHEQQPSHQQQQISRTTANLMYSNLPYPLQQQNYHHMGIPIDTGGGGHLPQMSHSRSLEHYSEPAILHQVGLLPHRHSFDHQQQSCTGQHQSQHHNHQLHHHQHHHLPQQQQNYYQHLNQPQQNFYESPYDCIDGNSLGGGSSNISYAAVAANAAGGGINCNFNANATYSHPYNVSGNRIPLPFNISHQLSAYDNSLPPSAQQQQEPTYAHVTDHHKYATFGKLPQNFMANSTTGIGGVGGYNELNHAHVNTSLQNSSKDLLQRQRFYQTEQLIDFEDPPILPPPPTSTQQQFDHHYQSQYQQQQQPNHVMDKRYNIMTSPLPASQQQQNQHYGATKPSPMLNNDMYVYAKPTPKENRKPNTTTDSLRKTSFISGELDTTDLNNKSSSDDFTNIPRQQNERNHQRSPTQFTKNQDGVGSYESWDYVFQNLNRSGYSKDLGERQDLLLQSLDLDALNINNDTSPSQTSSSAEKRRLNYAGNDVKPTTQQQPQSQIKQKTRTFDRSTSSSSKNITKMELLASASSSSALLNGKQSQSQASMDNNKKIKSALKQTNATSKTNSPTNINSTLNKTHMKPDDNKSKPPPPNNNNNNNSVVLTKRKKSSASASAPQQTATKKSSGTTTTTITPNNPPTSTQIIVTSPNEWSCKFCTFLNPNTKRICEMCCRSKDFILDASTTNNTSTAGGSSPAVSHNQTRIQGEGQWDISHPKIKLSNANM